MNTAPEVENFSLAATSGLTLTLKDFLGRKVVLFFYPKDNTAGCTSESVAFANAYDLFADANVEVLGISKDSIKSHEVFKKKYQLPFELLSDTDGAVCRQFDVIGEKVLYGRKIMGIVRSTFLLDEQGRLIKAWRGVKVKDHVPEVLAALGIALDDRDLDACRVPG